MRSAAAAGSPPDTSLAASTQGTVGPRSAARRAPVRSSAPAMQPQPPRSPTHHRTTTCRCASVPVLAQAGRGLVDPAGRRVQGGRLSERRREDLDVPDRSHLLQFLTDEADRQTPFPREHDRRLDEPERCVHVVHRASLAAAAREQPGVVERLVPAAELVGVDRELGASQSTLTLPRRSASASPSRWSRAAASRFPMSYSKVARLTYGRGRSLAPHSSASDRHSCAVSSPPNRSPRLTCATETLLSASASASWSPCARAMSTASRASGSASAARPAIAQRTETAEMTRPRTSVGPRPATSTSARSSRVWSGAPEFHSTRSSSVSDSAARSVRPTSSSFRKPLRECGSHRSHLPPTSPPARAAIPARDPAVGAHVERTSVVLACARDDVEGEGAVAGVPSARRAAA